MADTGRAHASGIEVRPTRDEDRTLLIDHLDALPEEDRWSRFCGTVATAVHVDRWLQLPADGGETFIALASDPTGGTRCVGEAGFVPRGDGTAEFALSVAVDRRGGLGSVLLEYLRHAAAARGIQALHGDVLTSNHAMRHMLQRRGAVTIDSDDGWTSSLLPTGRGTPRWPHTGERPRVLIEASGGTWAGEARFREAGAAVAVCAGPRSRPAADPCPVLVGRPCALVEGADVIVHDLERDGADHAQVLAGVHVAAGDRPLLARPAHGDDNAHDSVAHDAVAEAIDVWRERRS